MNSEKILKSQILQNAINDIVKGDTVLRPKQHEAFVKMADKELFEISDGYFRLPTAFGKTVMFSLMARAFLQNSDDATKVIILVPRLTLVGQTLDKLDEFANIKASIYTGATKDISADIIVSTYSSADRLFSELQAKRQDIGLVIADEAHHAIGERTSKVMQNIAKTTPVVGFTATPTFSDDHALGDLLSNELYTLSIEDCVKNELLCPVKNVLYCPSINFNILNAPVKSGRNADFDYKKLGRIIKLQTLVNEIARIYINEGDGDKKFRDMRAIINCPSVEIADKQAKKLNELAGRDIAISVHCDQKDFDKRVNAFLDKKYPVVCQVNTLTEGLDDASVELCINYPSYSPVKIEQSGGRVLRTDENNSEKLAYVMDTVFRAKNDESLETSLKRAFVAGQVLYRDVTGEFIVLPNENKKWYNQSSKKGGQKTTGEPFEIISDIELLQEANMHYKEWQRDARWNASGYVPPVDELHDMSPKYLATKLFNPKTAKKPTPREIAAKLQWMQPSMPYAIQLKRAINNRKVLHLRDAFLDKFIRNSGFELVVPKTKRDISASDIEQMYSVTGGQAKLRIIKLGKQIHAKYKMDGNTGRMVLCFDKRYLDKVTEVFVPKQTRGSDYLDASALSNLYLAASIDSIKQALKDIYEKAHPDNGAGQSNTTIPNRPPRNLKEAVILRKSVIDYGTVGYRLHKDFIDEFCAKKHFKKQAVQENENKSDNLARHKPRRQVVSLWKTEKQLVNYISTYVNPEALHTALDNFAKQHPNAVKMSTDYKSILFNLAYLKALCDFAKLTPIPVPLKTKSWKTAAELKAKYIDADIRDISKALDKLSGDEDWVIYNSISTMMNPETDTPEPCLHIRDINYFITSCGFKRKKGKLDIKTLQHGTKLVETLDKIDAKKSKKSKGRSK